MTPPHVESYVQRLRQELRRHFIADPQIIDEVRGHLIDAVERAREQEDSRAAEEQAIERFGSPELVAAAFVAGRTRILHRCLSCSSSPSEAPISAVSPAARSRRCRREPPRTQVGATAAVVLSALAVSVAAQSGALETYVRSERSHTPRTSVAVKDGKGIRVVSYGVADLEFGTAATTARSYRPPRVSVLLSEAVDVPLAVRTSRKDKLGCGSG